MGPALSDHYLCTCLRLDLKWAGLLQAGSAVIGAGLPLPVGSPAGRPTTQPEVLIKKHWVDIMEDNCV